MSYEWNRAQFSARAKRSAGQADSGPHWFIQLMPATPLRPYIAHYSFMSVSESAPIRELMLCALPRLDFVTSGSWAIGNQHRLHGPILRGPQSRAEIFQSSGSESLTVALTPLGLQMIGANCAEALANRAGSATALLEHDFETLLGALRTAPSPEAKADIADALFLRMLDQAEKAPDPVLAALQRWIADPDAVSVEAMCARLGVSHSKLGRLCRRYFGFTPKFLLRRARFLRMLDQLNLQPYREWPTFLDPRYVDQSHFIRDFHAFMGMTPSCYLASPRPMALAQLHEQQLLDCFAEQRMAA
jgi:AraC-like DNA-binding protein